MVIETDATPGKPALSTGPMSLAALRVPLAFAISCFFIWGLAYGLLEVLNKHFQETLDVGKAESAWLQIAYFGAYLLLSVPAGYLLQARGYKTGLIAGLVVTALGGLLFIPSAEIGSFPAFVGAMFVLAAGLCVLETSADTYVNVLGKPEHASRRLNLAQSFNGLGVFFGPLLGGAVIFNPWVVDHLGGDQRSVQIIYAVIAAAVLIYALVLSRARLPEISDADHHGEDGGAKVDLARQPHFVLGVLTQALYVGAQVGVGAYFLNLVTETWDGLSTQQGAFMLSIAAGGYLAGRFISTGLLLKVTPRTLLTTYGLANTALTIVVAMGIEKISAIALIAVFFFMSAMFATIFALGVNRLGGSTKRGASLMVMAIGGGVMLPWPMGKIAEVYGTPAAYLLPSVCFALVAWYGWKGAGLGRKETV
jgi:FHS family L-fucose permease-like MFS transporter